MIATVTLQIAEFPLVSVAVYVTVWLPMRSVGDPGGSVVVDTAVMELSLVVAAGRLTLASGRPLSVLVLKLAGHTIVGSSLSEFSHTVSKTEVRHFHVHTFLVYRKCMHSLLEKNKK